MVPYIARMARDLMRRSYIVRVWYANKLYLVVVLHNLRTMIHMLRCSWIVAFCYCTLLVYFTVIVPLGLRSFTSLQGAVKHNTSRHLSACLSFELSFFLSACSFFCCRDLRFCQYDAATATVQREEKRRGEEQKGRAEKKSRQEEAQTLLK